MKAFLILLLLAPAICLSSTDDAKKDAARKTLMEIMAASQMRDATSPGTYYLYGMANMINGKIDGRVNFSFISSDECIKYRDANRVLYPAKGISYECIEREDVRPRAKVIKK